MRGATGFTRNGKTKEAGRTARRRRAPTTFLEGRDIQHFRRHRELAARSLILCFSVLIISEYEHDENMYVHWNVPASMNIERRRTDRTLGIKVTGFGFPARRV